MYAIRSYYGTWRWTSRGLAPGGPACVSPSRPRQEVPAVTLSKEQKQGIIGKFKIHEADSSYNFV